MKDAWQAYLNLLPVWMREPVDKQGRGTLQELRLRVDLPPEMITAKGRIVLDKLVTSSDVQFVINVATKYSPWTAAGIADGFVTAPSGHRIGICGEAIVSGNVMTGIRNVSSVCIRVARDFLGIAKETTKYSGSVLIIGKPGSGKTTLLRDMIRCRSNNGNCVSVVDERGEIFPFVNGKNCFFAGYHTDVLSGCSKSHGILCVLRTMTPETIAVDEITAEADCDALLHAGWCGVKLLATAHAGSREDLLSRPVYHKIIDKKIFDTLIVMRPDKSWYVERMYL